MLGISGTTREGESAHNSDRKNIVVCILLVAMDTGRGLAGVVWGKIAGMAGGSTVASTETNGVFPISRFDLALLLVAITGMAYFPAIRDGFTWDDEVIYSNQQMVGWEGLWDIWTKPGENYREVHYWPVTYSSLWLDYQIWHMDARGYYLTNIALHACNSILVWLILTELGLETAFMVALLFALHPVHVESVAWAIERKDVLSSLFYLLACLTFLRFHKSGGTVSLLTTCALYIFGLLSKSSVISFPLGCVLCMLTYRGGVSRRSMTAICVLVAIGSVVGVSCTGIDRASADVAEWSFLERICCAIQSLWRYLHIVVNPQGCVPLYPKWNPLNAIPFWMILSATAAAACILSWKKRRRLGTLCAVFFVGTLSPVLGIVQFDFLRYSFVADRYLYLACLGPFVFVCESLHSLARRIHGYGQNGLIVLGVGTCILLFTLTREQCRLWADGSGIWLKTIEVNPNCSSAWINLGASYQGEGKFPEAMRCFRTAQSREPSCVYALKGMMEEYGRIGDDENAERIRNEVAVIEPRFFPIYNTFAGILESRGENERAISEYETSLTLNPYQTRIRKRIRSLSRTTRQKGEREEVFSSGVLVERQRE